MRKFKDKERSTQALTFLLKAALADFSVALSIKYTSFIFDGVRALSLLHASLGALPSRFRRPRILVLGCGDVGLRALPQLVKHARVMVLTSSAHKLEQFRAKGVTPLLGNLDEPASLKRLAGLGERVLHLAPPRNEGPLDQRTRNLLAALSLRTRPFKVVYGSTSGVYGNCQGEWVKETRALRPQSERAMRRVDAESQLRLWLQRSTSSVHINVLRIPGIYALDREGGTPLDRVKKGMPVLDERDDVYTNHIHADDLARACVLALYRGDNLQAIHVSDDAQMKMGDYYTEVAKWFNLPVPMRLPLSQLKAHLSPMQMSFLVESRRLDNQRMKKSLGLQLRYPTPKEGLGAEAGAGAGE